MQVAPADPPTPRSRGDRPGRGAILARVLSAVAVSTAATLAHAAPATGAALVACGTVRTLPHRAVTLDDRGRVAGEDWRHRAYIYDPATGSYEWLGGIEGRLPSKVTSLSPRGDRATGNAEVASARVPGATTQVGWRRDHRSRRLVPLATPYGYEATMVRIDDAGDAVGELTKVDEIPTKRRPFVVRNGPGGGLRQNLLMPWPFDDIGVRDVSASGAILGSAPRPTGPRPVIWHQAAEVSFGPRNMEAVAFLDVTRIVGYIPPATPTIWNLVTGQREPFLVERDVAHPLDANDKGWVTGGWGRSANELPGGGYAFNRAWIWHASVGQRFLDIPADSATGRRINNAGQVLVDATEDGILVSKLWTPC